VKNGMESWFPRRLVSSHCVGCAGAKPVLASWHAPLSSRESSQIVLPDFSDDGLKAAGKARDCCEGVNTATLES